MQIRTVHNRWNMYRGDSTSHKDLICTIKTPNIGLLQFKLEYRMFLANNTSNEQNCDFTVKKGYNNQQMTFYQGDTDKAIAQMHVRQNTMTKILEQDSYGLTIYANMDYAFIVAIASIIDAARDAKE
jgi:LURP-one-related